MSKAILISIKPKWCAKIMNGEKTIEIRKNKALANAIQKLIDENGYADIYVYCSKGKPNLWLPYEYDCFKLDISSQPYLSNKPIIDCDYKMNDKVVFKFRCYKVEEIEYVYSVKALRYVPKTNSLTDFRLIYDSGLTFNELNEYLKESGGYAIHISDLEIFDKPKELSEFNHWTDKKIQWYSVGEKVKVMVSLTKAPQNMCYVEIGE